MSSYLTPFRLGLCAVVAAAAAVGCSPEHYRAQADRVAYAIVASKTPTVPGMLADFSIETPEQDMAAVVPAEPISLSDALRIATLNSRQYQSRKESLYRSALSLSRMRHSYAPNPFGRLSADYSDTDTGDEKKVSGSSAFGFDWLLGTGARLGVDLTTSLSKLLSGDRAEAAGSAIGATLTQPLLRGFGIDTNEPLIQAERDMIYQMRDFVRFRRAFFVGIVAEYYSVLEQAKVLENQRVNLESLRVASERAQMLYDGGRLRKFELDQSTQDELDAENDLQFAEQRYRDSLDSLKISLGLPTDVELRIDPGEEARLTDTSVVSQIALAADAAAQIALENRLDLVTAEQRIEDRERRLKIARLELLPGLDLSAATDVDTAGDTQALSFRSERTDYSVGLDLELPFDRVSERNAYRNALIDLDQARRDYTEARDRIVLEIRDAWRQYHRAINSYRILNNSLKLAEQRVESTQMLLEAGEADMRDTLEARRALLSARNSLIGAVVDYKLASLNLARDMDILQADANGRLKESFDEYQ